MFWIAVGLLITLDLLSKSLIFESVGEARPPQPILGDWLSFYCMRNAGGIWGLGNGAGITPILTLVRLLAVGALLYFVSKQPAGNPWGVGTLALLVAGATGNLYDNLSSWLPWPGDGRVRDFIRVDFAEPGWWPDAVAWPLDPFPIFNFADACISVGFVLLITGLSKLQFQTEEAKKG